MRTIINRFDLHRFERLVSKLVKPSELPAFVSVVPCSGGLQFAAFCNDAVLTLTVATGDTIKPITLPWTTLKELAARKNGVIECDVNGKDVTLSWSDGGVPQTRDARSLEVAGTILPPVPENTAAHSVRLLDAMVDASQCLDSESSRYSLGSICLRGARSEILSTDGRQALIQEGFAFPFKNDLLCPPSRIFASKELRESGDTVTIGFSDDYACFGIGNVHFWLKAGSGKFPQVDQFAKEIGGHTWLHLDPTDALFVSERLPLLPGREETDSPVHVELGTGVAVRGHDTAQKRAAELRLARSGYDGAGVKVSVNRKFLKNAIAFGITRIGFDPKENGPLVGYGDQKQFIVMPLDGEEPTVEPGRLTVLVSDAKRTALPKNDKPVKVSQTSRGGRPKPKTGTNRKAVVLDDALKLRQNLRETLAGVNDLIRSIQTQRRQDKLLRDTVASLQKLQNV